MTREDDDRQPALRTTGRYRVVVPVPSLADALPHVDASTTVRGALAAAFTQDTLRAALKSRQVGDVLVATADPVITSTATGLGAAVLDCPIDLHGVLASARDAFARTGLDGPTAVLHSALPCLLATELDQALRSTGRSQIEILDLAGLHPTLLASRTGWPDETPVSDTASPRAAWLTAQELLPGLSCHVATLEGLRVAAYLGVGPATSAALRELKLPGFSWKSA
jgi:2-phospho-L-lactate/phosphoenolpyruvate guanylyltransferase